MPANNFTLFSDSPTAPASRAFPITPDNAAMLPEVTKALYVGTGGHIVVLPLDGTTDVTFRNVPDGSILDVRVQAIRATGTTAADIVGLA